MKCYLVALILSITSITSIATAADAVSVMMLDGSEVSGSLESWAGGRVVLATADGDQSLSESEILSIQWPRGAAAEPQPTPAVELVDGTRLPITGFHTAGGQATLTLLDKGSLAAQTLVLPIKSIAAVELQPLNGELVGHWAEIRELALPSDVLVVLKRAAGSLDYVEGIVGAVTNEEVEFSLDGEPITVRRSKVAGLIYYRTETSTEAAPCMLVDRNGARINGASVRLENLKVRVTTPAGVELSWPLNELRMADFSAGKLVYLSDMEPASARWAPLVGLPAAMSVARSYGAPRSDESAFGGRLALRVPFKSYDTIEWQTQEYSKGLAIRSRTELVYRLPRGYSRLLGLAGIEPATTAAGNVLLRIEGDGRLLAEVPIEGQQPPLPLDVDISGISRLSITVDYGDNVDAGDWLNLCNVRIVK